MKYPKVNNLRVTIICCAVLISFLYLMSTNFFRLNLAQYYFRQESYDSAVNCYQKIFRRALARGNFHIGDLKKNNEYEKIANFLIEAYFKSAIRHLKVGAKYTKEKLWEKGYDELIILMKLDDGFRTLFPVKYFKISNKKKWDTLLEKAFLDVIRCSISLNRWMRVLECHIRIATLDYEVSFKKRNFKELFGLEPAKITSYINRSFDRYRAMLFRKWEMRSMMVFFKRFYLSVFKKDITKSNGNDFL